jgi:hypothetical protein
MASPGTASLVLRTVRSLTRINSPCASLRAQRCRVHRILPNVRDDGQRPSSGQDGGTSSFDLPDGESEIFLQRGLERDFADLPVGHIGRILSSSNGAQRCRRRACGIGSPDGQNPIFYFWLTTRFGDGSK